MIAFAHFWLSGAWWEPAPSLGVKDINGVVLSVGDNVKLDGVIVQIYPKGSSSGKIQVRPLHPTTSEPLQLCDSLQLEKV